MASKFNLLPSSSKDKLQCFCRNELHDLLGHGNDLLEGVITNGAKSWPPSIPEIHAVQYYGMNLLSKILSGKHEEVSEFERQFYNNLCRLGY